MHWVYRSQNYMDRADQYMQKSGRGESEESAFTFMASGVSISQVCTWYIDLCAALADVVLTLAQFYFWCHLLYGFLSHFQYGNVFMLLLYQ